MDLGGLLQNTSFLIDGGTLWTQKQGDIYG